MLVTTLWENLQHRLLPLLHLVGTDKEGFESINLQIIWTVVIRDTTYIWWWYICSVFSPDTAGTNIPELHLAFNQHRYSIRVILSLFFFFSITWLVKVLLDLFKALCSFCSTVSLFRLVGAMCFSLGGLSWCSPRAAWWKPPDWDGLREGQKESGCGWRNMTSYWVVHWSCVLMELNFWRYKSGLLNLCLYCLFITSVMRIFHLSGNNPDRAGDKPDIKRNICLNVLIDQGE